ncbi:MAG: DUF1349 domain-containing protein [Anaerolineae bacterium]|jgi:regulation of enolase protein 1 (concanavalin A-like superfamily)|nr:DUF1349 domain-containing protein [Chloroflexota bacterium]
MAKVDLTQFQWLNPSTLRREGEAWVIAAPAESDFFRSHSAPAADGTLPDSKDDAPYLYTSVTGDFVLRARVQHGFADTYDACALMVRVNEQVWGKICFEKTDFDTHAVVSVVTNGVSDDANGPNVEGDTLWLQMVRVGRSFALHYSLDGKQFFMLRYFYLPASETVQVGLVAQAPRGSGGERYFYDVTLESRTVGNIRSGV